MWDTWLGKGTHQLCEGLQRDRVAAVEVEPTPQDVWLDRPRVGERTGLPPRAGAVVGHIVSHDTSVSHDTICGGYFSACVWPARGAAVLHHPVVPCMTCITYEAAPYLTYAMTDVQLQSKNEDLWYQLNTKKQLHSTAERSCTSRYSSTIYIVLNLVY